MFYGENMDDYFKIIPVTPSYLEHGCYFIKGNTPPHIDNYVTGS